MRTAVPARTTLRRTPVRWVRVAVALALVATVAATFGLRMPVVSPATGGPVAAVRDEGRGALGEADGALPDGTTVFDDDLPGVANLAPALAAALRRAGASAADEGLELEVNSGWRSAAYQRMLRREAVSTYGSAAEAARWVASPTTSRHVAGDAADIGPADAAAWLSREGSRYGLCRVYANEPWHFELRPDAVADGCPALLADAAHDPRLRR